MFCHRSLLFFEWSVCLSVCNIYHHYLKRSVCLCVCLAVTKNKHFSTHINSLSSPSRPCDTSKLITSSRGSVWPLRETPKITISSKNWTTISHPSVRGTKRDVENSLECSHLNCILAPRSRPLDLAAHRPALALWQWWQRWWWRWWWCWRWKGKWCGCCSGSSLAAI